MNRFLLLFVVLLNFLSFEAHTQVLKYEKFEFDSIQPKWLHMAVDSSIIGDTLFVPFNSSEEDTILFDGWSHIGSAGAFWGNYTVKNGTNIYSLKYIFNNGAKGGYLESLNSETGLINWKTIWDFRTIQKMEFPENLFINSKGNIEVIGLRYDAEGFNESPINNSLVVREFNKNTGKLLNFSYGDLKEEGTKKMILPYRTSRASKFLLYSYNENQYQYIQLLQQKKLYNSYILDNKGKVINEKHIDIDLDLHDFKYSFFDNSFQTMGNFGFIGFRHTRASGFARDSFDIFIDLIDQNFNIEKTKYLSDVLEDSDDYRLHWSNKDYFILEKFDEDSFGSKYLYKHSFIVFDRQFNKIETIKLQNKNGQPLDVGSPKAIKLKNDKGLLVVATGYDFVYGFNSLNFYKSDGNGFLDTLKIIKVKNKKHNIVADFVYQLDNGDILIDGRDINENYLAGLQYLAGSWLICFNASDIGITSTQDYVSQRIKTLKIYPNPANNKINVSIDDNIVGNLKIYDVLGRLVFSTYINGDQKQIDISNLSKGTYSIKIDSQNRITFTGNFIKK